MSGAADKIISEDTASQSQAASKQNQVEGRFDRFVQKSHCGEGKEKAQQKSEGNKFQME